MFVCSAGGHLIQLLRLQNIYDGERAILITEKTPSTEAMVAGLKSRVLFLPHGGRESPFLFIWKFSWNIVISMVRLIWYQPSIVISTGAHTAVPTCILGKCIGAKIIFIETFARIRSPSLTGRIVYRIADRFYVQWPDMKKFYKKAQYEGKLY